MSKTRVAPARPTPKALTLADVTVAWKDGDVIRTATGRQIAYLLTAAAAENPSGHFGHQSDAPGQWAYQLQGLSYLVFPDAGVSIREGDARALVSNLLERAGAELAADSLDSEKWPAAFRVHVRAGSGRAVVAPQPTVSTAHLPRGGAA